MAPEYPRSSRSGFSLVELLAATLMAGFLLVTIGMMLVRSYEEYVACTMHVELQRDAMASIDTIRRQVMATPGADVYVTTNQLDLVAGGITRRFHGAGTDLIYDPDISSINDEVILVDQRLVDFRPIPKAGFGVLIELDLGAGGPTQSYRTTVGFRQ